MKVTASILPIVKYGLLYVKIKRICLEVTKKTKRSLVTDFVLVEALYPAQISYPNTEWLIGNHADELVPW